MQSVILLSMSQPNQDPRRVRVTQSVVVAMVTASLSWFQVCVQVLSWECQTRGHPQVREGDFISSDVKTVKPILRRRQRLLRLVPTAFKGNKKNVYSGNHSNEWFIVVAANERWVSLNETTILEWNNKSFLKPEAEWSRHCIYPESSRYRNIQAYIVLMV